MNSIINYIAKQWGFARVTHQSNTSNRSAAQNALNGVMHHLENNGLEFFEVVRVLRLYKNEVFTVKREVIGRCLNKERALELMRIKWSKESGRVGCYDAYNDDVNGVYEWSRVDSFKNVSREYSLVVLRRELDVSGSYSMFNDVIGGE